jgi:hypothetical protein
MMPSSYYLYTAFYCYFRIANVKQILVYFININLTSNGSLFKRILLLILLTLTSLSVLQRIVLDCVVARCLGGSVAICIVIHCLRCCPLSALRWVVMSPCCLRCGASSLSALLAIVWVVALSCASLSVMWVVVHCLHHHPLSASRWGFRVTSSSATRL